MPMPTRKDHKRPAPISYRPPVSLREEFAARVEKSGLSTCAYITRAVFNVSPSRQYRRPPLEQKLLARLLCEAAKIHADLEQINSLDGDDSDRQIETATETLIEIRAALLKAMGRNP